MFKLYYSDTFVLPLPPHHKFPMQKYRLLRDRIADWVTPDRAVLLVAPAASDEQLVAAHTPDYVRRVAAGELSEVEIRRIGFPWSPAMVERARRSVGGTIAAANAALRDGFSANLAGGTHHAFADSGQGYCVFNDTAVAAKWLLQQSAAQQIAIVDLDVHQGNGTAAIAADEPRIHTLSIHCEDNFPYRKTSSDVDIALPAGTADADYLSVLQSALSEVFGGFHPDLVLYVSGADAFAEDRFGKLRLTKCGLAQRDRLVYEFFSRQAIPLAVTMAGGYARNVSDIVDIHSQTIALGMELSEQSRAWPANDLPDWQPSPRVPESG